MAGEDEAIRCGIRNFFEHVEHGDLVTLCLDNKPHWVLTNGRGYEIGSSPAPKGSTVENPPNNGNKSGSFCYRVF